MSAKLSLETQLLEAVKGRLTAEAAKATATAEYRNAVDAMISQFDAQQTENILNMYSSQLEQHTTPFMSDPAIIEKQEERAISEVKEIGTRIVRFPLLDESGRLVKNDQGEVATMPYYNQSDIPSRDILSKTQNAIQVLNIIEELDDIQLSALDKKTPGIESDRANPLANSLKIAAANFSEAGTLSRSNLKVIEGMTGDPFSILQKAYAMRNELRRQVSSDLNNYRTTSAPKTASTHISEMYQDTSLSQNSVFVAALQNFAKEEQRANEARRVSLQRPARAMTDLNEVITPKQPQKQQPQRREIPTGVDMFNMTR
jgi:hypothetical protein